MSREQVRQALEVVPDPSNGIPINPCTEQKYSKTNPILHRLSCSAKNNKIYVAAIMGDMQNCSKTIHSKCPDDGLYQFNTIILFDDNGYLKLKYHKMHLFGELYYNPAPNPELMYADTPFGRLGVFNCFDIIFKSPGIDLVHHFNVTTMLFPHWWFDLLPFLTAIQWQQAWAFTNQVNLLASNSHIPSRGSLGSGIYSGHKGAVVYSYEPDGKPKLLIADIPINPNSKTKCEKNEKIIEIDLKSIFEKPKLLKEEELIYKSSDTNFNKISQVFLTEEKNQITHCNDNFCCKLNYAFKKDYKFADEKFYFIMTNRSTEKIFPQVDDVWCEESCALIRCKHDKNGHCESFSHQTKTLFQYVHIKATFGTKFIYPSATTNNNKPISVDQWKFSMIEKENNQYEAEISINSNDKPLLVLGMYGRCYHNDPIQN